MEVLLAMAIAILIMGAITMAVDFHLRVLDTGRREVEEAQLARAILRRIADDLRSTVRYQKIDVESMLSQAASNTGAASALSGSSGSSGSGGSGGGAGGGQTLSPQQPQTAGSSGQPSSSQSSGSGSEESESTNQDLSESAVVNAEPGLYGNLYELQVDVSRLPRIDQYERMLATPDSRPTDVVSDVKTVAYYVLDGSAGAAGLVRREMDRAATSWAINNGGLDELSAYEELLAPEVAALEFRYFDGYEWFDEWDSTAAQNVPVAVEISLAIAAPTVDRSTATLVDLATLAADPGYRIYRLLVHLPAAKTLAEQEADAAAEAAKAEASGTTSTTSSANSGQGSTP
jgi:hypothetical protein